ncbi:hypothetical protein BC936DRAFT_140840 [Jimgerdemannia flammicorona]|uniref:Uncharacterized protein n=1 Tax=Jimgerdemannia flammicorona TaxID=994334 RepID=A0A433A3E3_9FUNG|nr:hypothetical protein BC936DRAFT_140840 [Jimgerdemannia flammicorona]
MQQNLLANPELVVANSFENETSAFKPEHEDSNESLFFNPLIKPATCPATCELCNEWMPKHKNDCPRFGVHPSQWHLFILIERCIPNSKSFHSFIPLDIGAGSITCQNLGNIQNHIVLIYVFILLAFSSLLIATRMAGPPETTNALARSANGELLGAEPTSEIISMSS